MGDHLTFESAVATLRISKNRSADFLEPLMIRILDHTPRGPRDLAAMVEAVIIERTEGTRTDNRDLKALKRIHAYLLRMAEV